MEKLISNLDSFNMINFNQPIMVSNLSINILYARFMNSHKDSWNMENHRHSYYEMHMPLEENFEILTPNNNSVKIEKGRYIIIHPQTYHKITNVNDNCIRLSIAFNISNGYTSVENCCFSHSCSETVISNVKNMLVEYLNLDTGYESMIKSYLQLILIDCIRGSLIYRRSDSEKLPPVFQNAIEYINHNLLSDINVERIADYCNISSRHLNRIFKESIGVTVPQYVRNERIKIAKKHLCGTPKFALKEIAQLSGFSDEYMLSKVFSRVVGISAKEYREINMYEKDSANRTKDSYYKA